MSGGERGKIIKVYDLFLYGLAAVISIACIVGIAKGVTHECSKRPIFVRGQVEAVANTPVQSGGFGPGRKGVVRLVVLETQPDDLAAVVKGTSLSVSIGKPFLITTWDPKVASLDNGDIATFRCQYAVNKYIEDCRLVDFEAADN